MSQNEKEAMEQFSLDDILNEFSDHPAQPEAAEESARAEPEAVSTDTIRVELPAEEPNQPVQPVTGDTIRLDSIAKVLRETANPQDTLRYAPVDEEEEPAQPEEPEQEEAFGENWQPEFEQPIGNYVPPQPIVFRPRSRLRELKRQLIAGPEKRYYEISEKGLIPLQLAILCCLLVALLSSAVTVMQAVGAVSPDRMRLMVFSQFFAMMVSALLGSQQLLDGILDLGKKRFSLNTLMFITFIACVADGIFGLRDLRIPCCAAFCLEVLMSLWSSYQKRVTELGQMDTLRKAVRLDGVSKAVDYHNGMSALLRSEGQVADFMDNYAAVPKPEKTLGLYGLLVLLVSLAAAVLATVLHGISLGVQVLAVSLLAGMPATAFITVSRPTAVLEKRLHRLGSVICGWQGVEGMKGKLVFPLTHEDLFPSGACRMNGVKFYGDRDPDEVVAYAAALMETQGGGVAPLFTQLLESRNGRHYNVFNLRDYNNGGIGAEINGEAVLAGNLEFVKQMGVEVPEGIRVDQAVYVAIDGELSGLFAITYNKARSSAMGIATLCGYRKLKTVMVTNDFMLTEGFLRSKFGVSTRRMEFPESAVRKELSEKGPQEGATMYALTTETGLAPIAYAITGARALRTATKIGVGIHLAGGIAGLAMMVALAFIGAGYLLTPLNMLLFELIWMIPGLLITEWTRSV